MRGLKLRKETNPNNIKVVASFTDAWIETEGFVNPVACCVSHLLQMRGLKQKLSDLSYNPFQSHLLQMRGLKLLLLV